MQKIILVITYTAYTDSIREINQPKLEEILEDHIKANLDRIWVDPQTGNDEDDQLEFDFVRLDVATDSQIAFGWGSLKENSNENTTSS